MTMENEETIVNSSESLSGKYLSFALANEQYAVNILKVIEIFGMCNITSIPRTPDYIKGVINLRGKIIPVVDLRLKFGIEEKEYDARTCIIVMNIELGEEKLALGIIVDTVLEVRDFVSHQISASPDYGAQLNDEFIMGMGKFEDGRVSILIDIEKAFNSADRAMLEESLR